jgi:hypothetical protein
MLADVPASHCAKAVMRPPGVFLIIVDEGPGSPKGTGALFRATAVTPVNAEVQTAPTTKVPPRQPLMQIKDRHERRAKPACRGRRDDKRAVTTFAVVREALRSSAWKKQDAP